MVIEIRPNPKRKKQKIELIIPPEQFPVSKQDIENINRRLQQDAWDRLPMSTKLKMRRAEINARIRQRYSTNSK